MTVVCDASVATAWYADEVQSPAARVLQAGSERLVAPTILLVETANALLMRAKRGLPTPSDYPAAALHGLRGGSIVFTDDLLLLDSAVVIARRLPHSIYDCLYLALCRREEAVLATFDKRLAQHATTLAIPLWTPEAA